jgi:hypothetical protein
MQAKNRQEKYRFKFQLKVFICFINWIIIIIIIVIIIIIITIIYTWNTVKLLH